MQRTANCGCGSVSWGCCSHFLPLLPSPAGRPRRSCRPAGGRAAGTCAAPAAARAALAGRDLYPDPDRDRSLGVGSAGEGQEQGWFVDFHCPVLCQRDLNGAQTARQGVWTCFKINILSTSSCGLVFARKSIRWKVVRLHLSVMQSNLRPCKPAKSPGGFDSYPV